ncbi:MAG TPA: M48 family metalloprotease [Candidatus Baltobacteraceae bacterium]|nr:M48 family metalloprotease [Candidatus Baltobacteraceae bacterium]
MTALVALAIARPNALDREVSAIPAHDLLTRSPFDLVDPLRAAAATHLEQMQLLLWVIVVALQIGVLAWFWRSGQSAALRDRLRAEIGSEFWVRFAFGAALALLDKAVAFIPLAAQYRYLRIMGLTEQLFRTWLLGWIGGTLVAMLVAGFLAAAVLWLADRTHQWYLYTLAGIMAVSLLAAFAGPAVAVPALEPPALTRTLAGDIASMRARTGITAPIEEQRIASRTRLGTAFVSGLGSSQRIVVTDTLLASQTEEEMRYVVARAMVWISSNTALDLALVQGAFLILGAALAVTISDRIGFRRDDDPVSRLALLGAIIGLVYLVAAPFYNGYSRNLDISADRAALAITHDPASAIRMQIRRADQALVPVCPSELDLWYLSPHPAPGPRIAAFQGAADACATRR